ncbi:hypothetical protein TrVGV298_004863 [Trichoderma virens]|nr:hypothetical protein TrVGV298_004863 [Trichoderma virens]
MGRLSGRGTWPWRSSEGLVTFAVAFAVFTDGLVYDLVIPFLPELFTGRLKTPPEDVDYWAALSLESFGMALLITNWIAGYLADGSVSKSRPFLVGIGVMLIATLLFFLSTDPYLIIFARALQGASEALVWVSGIAFLVSQVDEANLGVCMGYTTLGATVDHAASTDLERGGEDDRSALSGTTDCGGDDEDVSALRTLGWNWLSSVIGAAIACVVRSALEATIPIYVLRHFGWTSSAGGGVMFALLLPMVGGPWVGKYTTLHGPRWFSTIASLACGVFIVTLGFLTGDDPTTQILFVVNVGFIGLCISLGTTTQTTAISAAAQRVEALRSRIRASAA